MPVPVRLDFMPATLPDVTTLHIEEAPAADGVFTEIEAVTPVGAYPNYISYYTTQNATAIDYWFRIRWETSDGVFSPYSGTLQGGTKTLVQELVDRVVLRNPSMNEIIATQESQAVVSEIFPQEDTNAVPFTAATYVQLRGMTNLVLARSLISAFYTTATTGQANKWTAGLVAMDTGSTASSGSGLNADTIRALLELANKDLGMAYSVVLLMKEIEVAGGYTQLAGVDLTRTIAMVDIT